MCLLSTAIEERYLWACIMNQDRDRRQINVSSRIQFVLNYFKTGFVSSADNGMECARIANVNDVFGLSVFMQRLAERGKELQARFMKNHLPAFLDEIRKDPDVLKWSMCSRVSKKDRTKYKDELEKELKERQTRYPEPKSTSRGKAQGKFGEKEDEVEENVEGEFEEQTET